MNNTKCPCCNQLSLLRTDEIFNNHISLVCNNCGYENFVNNSQVDLAHFYEEDSDYTEDLTVSNSHKSLLQWNHRQATKFLSNMRNRKGLKTLDVGCFNGFFVKELLEYGYDSFGVDFNNKAIDFGISQYGLDGRLTCENIDSLIERKEKYDVITLFEVIEHLEEDPCKFLLILSKLLNKDGVLIVSAPNKRMMWRPALDYPPHHLSRFTNKSLQDCISSSQMHVMETYEQMSSFDLARNFIGSKIFRSGSKASSRGGEFKYGFVSILLRKMLNKVKWTMYFALYPIDKIMYFFGFRYIGQIVISKKIQ